MLKQRLSCMLASTFDWFDLSILALLAPVIAHVLFPQHGLGKAIYWFYVVVAISYLARPIGALIIGHWADKYGRHKTLFVTLSVSSILVVIIGCLPSEQSFLFATGVAVIVLRLLHGFFLGGLFSLTTTYLYEAQSKNRAINTCWTVVGIGLGVLLAYLVAVGLGEFLNPKQMLAWGWRLPFFFSIILLLIAFWIRYSMSENSEFIQVQNTAAKCPLMDGFRHNWQSIISLFFMTIFFVGAGFTLMIQAPQYWVAHFHFGYPVAITIAVISLFVFIVAVPFMATLSNRYSKLRLCQLSAIAMCLFAYPLYNVFRNIEIITAIAAQVVLLLIYALYAANFPALLAERFNTVHRVTSVGLVYNIAFVLFGGAAPLLVNLLAVSFRTNVTPAMYLIILALIAIAFSFVIKNEANE